MIAAASRIATIDLLTLTASNFGLFTFFCTVLIRIFPFLASYAYGIRSFLILLWMLGLAKALKLDCSVIKRKKINKDVMIDKILRPRNYFKLVSASIFLISVNGMLVYFLYYCTGFYHTSAMEVTLESRLPQQSGIAISISAIFAVIVEEIYSRGIYAGNLKQYDAIFAAIFSGVLFGLGHYATFPSAAVVGIILAFYYFSTESLLFTIVVHELNNSIGSSLIFKLQDYLTARTSSINVTYFLMGVILLAISVVSFVFVKKEGFFDALFQIDLKEYWRRNRRSYGQAFSSAPMIAIIFFWCFIPLLFVLMDIIW